MMGRWVLIVLADTKGDMTTAVLPGHDADIAFQTLRQSDAGARARNMVHWERGFATKSEARQREATLRAELGLAEPASGLATETVH